MSKLIVGSALAALASHSALISAGPAPSHGITRDQARGRHRTRDNMLTFDAATIDSTGSFLIGELERLDQTLHGPLAAVSWSRDIDLREDVTIADETSSWTNSAFAAAGGISPAGKNWIGKGSNNIPGIALDIGKTAQPLTLWGMELSWTIPELESSIKVGRPVDAQKFDGMQLKHNMDTDEQVYIGDTDLGFKGLTNSASVTPSNVVNGANGTPQWSTKTPDEILADVNGILTDAWAASGYAVVPNRLLLPPSNYSYLVATKISSLGNISILRYLMENTIALNRIGAALQIEPVKWLVGRGVGSTNRMIAYTKDKKYVRFPMVPLQRTPLEYRSIYQLTTYFGRLGVVEVVYPETIAYRDGI